jgi:REP element-mobilizing transposase RayT
VTYPRKTLVCLQDTPYYHVIARCVRRAWLWGFDEYAGRDYSHRKAWVLERLAQQSSVFAIDICAYAIMSNHYHLVVHVDAKRARTWSRKEVVARWTRLFARPTLVQRWEEESYGQAEREAAEAIIERWRARLMDVSWYMRCLNEYLARRANIEDDCTGRFWEGRFKSQALLDDAGLLTAMAYVDLNPVRAGIASTPEESEFTSIYERIRAATAASENECAPSEDIIPPLLSFQDRTSDAQAIPFSFPEYLALVDWTGRSIREDKRGHLDARLPPIAQRLRIDPTAWQAAMQPKGNVFGRALGQLDHLRLHAKALGQARIRGLNAAERMFRPA